MSVLLKPGLDRRMLLRGMLAGTGAVTVGLPWLEAFAQTAGFPKRLGVFFWGNGMLPDRWTPSGTGAEWTPSDQLAPLAPFREQLLVVTGCKVHTPNAIPHHSGSAGILTGSPVVMKGGEDYTFVGPSFDQVAAAKLGQTTRFRSIEAGVEPGVGISYNGPDSVNPPEKSPIRLFERLFGPGFRRPGEMSEPDPSLALRRSVLDAVLADAKRLQQRVGAADKQRLEEHLGGIRDLELRLARLSDDPPMLEACDRPPEPLPEYPDHEGRAQLHEKNQAICDVLTMALACDQSRVFTHVFTRPLNNLLFGDLPAGHHRLTHDEPDPQPFVHQVVLETMQAFAYLVERLQSVPEGDATLLDHCALVATSDISLGKIHSFDEFPLLVAGGAGGKLKRNFHYRSPSDENASGVVLSILRAVGVDLPEWGREEGRVTDGLGAIEV